MSYNWEDLLKQADEAGGFEPVPAGEYVVDCIKAVGKAAKSGRDMVVATLKIVGGPNNGRVVINNYVLVQDNPQALQIFFRNMLTFGIQREFFAQKPSIGAVAAQMVGKRVGIEVTVEPYGDRMTNQVKKTMSAGSVSGSPVSASAAPTPNPQPAPAAPLSEPQSSLPAAPAPAPQPAPAPSAPPAPPAAPADPSAPPPPPF